MARRILVVGAGVRGLTAAYRLKQLDHEVVILESTDHIGGAIETFTEGDYMVETGPNSIRLSEGPAMNLIKDLGLEDELLETSPAAKHRYILKDDHLHPLPTSPRGLLSTKLFSLSGKLRALTEFFRKKGPDSDESVKDFFERRFGREIVEYALDPFVSGIHAGNPAKLSVSHAFQSVKSMESNFGSILRGALKKRGKKRAKIYSFKEGMATLPECLGAYIGQDLYLNSRIESIQQNGLKWKIVAQTEDSRIVQEFDDVVLTVPSHRLNTLPFEKELSEQIVPLDEIDHPPMITLSMSFKREQVKYNREGFGFLIPSSQRRRILGAIFSSSVFSERCPEGELMFTCFLGGALNEQMGSLDQATAVKVCLEELGEILGVSGEPVWSHYKSWKLSIPQYNLGHEKYLEHIEKLETHYPGLHFLGNYRYGTSLPMCIEAGLNISNLINTKNTHKSYEQKSSTAS